MAEVLLWQQLRAKRFRGIKFCRQKPIGSYIIDFFSKELNLAIEIDGATHWDKEKNDLERQQNLEKKGIRFLRFEDRDVKNNLFFVMGRLGEWVDENCCYANSIDKSKDATSPLPPSRRGTR